MKKSLLALMIFALFIQAVVAQANTIISVNPSYSNLNLGDSLTIDIDISTTDSVYAFDISVYYDSSILNATQLTEGNFLNKDGEKTIVGTSKIDNNQGFVQFALTRYDTQDGVSGTGTLFTIDFNTIGAGTSQIGIDDVTIVNNTVKPLVFTANNGSAKVNTRPSIAAVVITPSPAYTPDILDCGFDVTDPDVLDTVRVNVTWLKNGGAWTQDDENGIVVASWGSTSPQGDIEPGDTVKGDTWVCRIIAYDELSEVTQDSSPVTIQNSLPTQPVIDVTPDSPYTVDDLLCSITTPSQDADGDTITYSYRWYKDGGLQSAYNNQATIPSSATTRDQTWKCVVTPNDGTGDGPAGEDQVTVLNSRPVAGSVSLAPPGPVTSDDLVGSYSYSDADSDPESGTEIRWYKDGGLQSAYNDGLIIPSTATAKGQDWYFTARPRDGSEFGSLKTSPTVTIQNSPPELSPIGDKAVLETNTLQFTVSASDNDTADTLVYGTNTSFGTFNTNTGEFSWATGWYDAGVYMVIFTVTDGTDTMEEVITITVNNNNRIPSIDSYSPLSLLLNTRTGRPLSFTHTSSDPDADDTLAYSWRVNGSERATTQNWAFSPDPSLSDCGDRDVKLVVTDSYDEVSQSWTVNVKLSGDVDLDGDVDILDLASVGLAYGSKPGDGNWNAQADLYPLMTEGSPEGDGVINIFDLATVGLNYGNFC